MTISTYWPFLVLATVLLLLMLHALYIAYKDNYWSKPQLAMITLFVIFVPLVGALLTIAVVRSHNEDLKDKFKTPRDRENIGRVAGEASNTGDGGD